MSIQALPDAARNNPRLLAAAADHLLESGDHLDLSRALAEAAVALDPDVAGFWSLLGRIEFEDQDYGAAARALEESVHRAPTAARFTMLASARRGAGDSVGAVEAAQEALKLDSEDEEATLEMALALEDLGRFSQAERLLTALTKTELAPIATQRLGIIALFNRSSPSEAEALLRQSYGSRPDPTTLYYLAEALEQQGQASAAAAAASELLGDSLFPSALVLGFAGDLFARLNDRAKAEQAFLAALSLDPRNAYALRGYCIMLAREGKLQQARDLAGHIESFDERRDLLEWLKQLDAKG